MQVRRTENVQKEGSESKLAMELDLR